MEAALHSVARAVATALRCSESSASGLGRWEYCTPRLAVSPSYMNSTGWMFCSFIQPVPVGTWKRIARRSNPPVRSNSAMARSTRSSRVSADSSPTNTRTGSRAGLPVISVICSGVGAREMNRRPCPPSDSQPTSEPGPAVRRALEGGPGGEKLRLFEGKRGRAGSRAFLDPQSCRVRVEESP